MTAETFISRESVGRLFKELVRIRSSRKEELTRLADEFVDPLELARFYVEPHLQDRNPANNRQDDLLTTTTQPAFEKVNHFFRGGPPLDKDGRHQMFILSDAGMGKTSLLLMVKLTRLTAFWPNKLGCELLKLGDDTLERVAKIEEKPRTILLLDALDEDRQGWKRIRERIIELLQATEDFHRVIISSRTQFFPEMEPDLTGSHEMKVLDGFHCPVLYLSPFHDEQVSEFIHKKLPLRWYHYPLFKTAEIREARDKAWHLVEQMDSLRMRPMLLNHIDRLLHASAERSWNAWQVYEALMHEWLDREERKFRRLHPDRPKLPGRKDLFTACVLIAERMQRKGWKVLREEELHQLIREDANVEWLEEFELGGRSLMNRNSDRAFRFSHYSIQEFLLAWGLMKGGLSANEEPLRVTDQMVRFLDVAGGLDEARDRLDFSSFNWDKYIESYWVFRDPMRGSAEGPAMLRIRGGRFEMGDHQGIGRDNERPVHEVTLGDFAIGRYPVTVGEFRQFAEATGFRDMDWRNPGFEQDDHHPVVKVNWKEALAYAKWLSGQTGKPYRLPSEAEWEYACRAGSSGAYCFGDDVETLSEYGWYDGNSGGRTHPVGQKRPNAWGVHDMHGNVWEWVHDWLGGNYYAESPRRSPTGPVRGSNRVFRGGSWINPALVARSASRFRGDPGGRGNDVGFRLARTLP